MAKRRKKSRNRFPEDDYYRRMTVDPTERTYYPMARSTEPVKGFRCPKCGIEIPFTSCGIQSDTARCDACKSEFPFHTVYRQTELQAVLDGPLPPNSSLTDDGELRSLVIYSPYFSIFVVAIIAIWFGGVVGGGLGKLFSLSYWLQTSLVLLPLFLPILCLLYHVKITDANGMITVFYGFLSFGKQFSFQRKTLQSVTLKTQTLYHEKCNRPVSGKVLTLNFKDETTLPLRHMASEKLSYLAAFLCIDPKSSTEYFIPAENPQPSRSHGADKELFCPQCSAKLPDRDFNRTAKIAWCQHCRKQLDFDFYTWKSSAFSLNRGNRLKMSDNSLKRVISAMRVDCIAWGIVAVALPLFMCYVILNALWAGAFHPLMFTGVGLVILVPAFFWCGLCSFGGKYYSIIKQHGEVIFFSWYAYWFSRRRLRMDDIADIRIYDFPWNASLKNCLRVIKKDDTSFYWGMGADRDELLELGRFLLRSDSPEKQMDAYYTDVAGWNEFLKNDAEEK